MATERHAMAQNSCDECRTTVGNLKHIDSKISSVPLTNLIFFILYPASRFFKETHDLRIIKKKVFLFFLSIFYCHVHFNSILIMNEYTYFRALISRPHNNQSPTVIRVDFAIFAHRTSCDSTACGPLKEVRK
jgi:hypothetical protein